MAFPSSISNLCVCENHEKWCGIKIRIETNNIHSASSIARKLLTFHYPNSIITKMPVPSLSEDSVHRTIDTVLASERSDGDAILRRTTTPDDWNSIMCFSDQTKRSGTDEESGTIVSVPDVCTPFYFGIRALKSETDQTLVGFCTFYIAYSTWDGRMLYVDQINSEAAGSLLLYQIMAKIAKEIGCARFTWKVSTCCIVRLA